MDRLRRNQGRPNRGRRWRALRAQVLREEPLCRPCRRAGRVTAGTEVDHIVALEDGGTDARENLQTICEECHKVKHGAPPRIGVDGWPVQ